MITHISIRDFAIIENTEIDFGPGLSVITGETGSGKSIVITAVSLALGSRADSAYVRHGCEKSVIELCGEVDRQSGEPEEFVIRREINASGRSVCRLNGRMVTLAELSEACRRIADIHGQYDNQSLLDSANHISLLDRFGHETISPLKQKYEEAYALYTQAKSEYENLLSLEKENKRKLDFDRYELREIDAAELKEDEDAALADRLSLMKNGERIYKGASEAYNYIESENGAYSALGNAANALEDISEYSDQIKKLLEQLNDAYYTAQDVASSLRELCESLNFSEEELDSLNERASLIDDLKKKYGSTIEEILAYRDRVADELNKIENYDSEKQRLLEAVDAARAALTERGSALTAARHDAAELLASRILSELRDLNFGESQIEIRVSPLEKPREDGFDDVEILISTNVGEPLKPLALTSSGGEISRIMLAIKNITAAYDKIPTLIFDEIDQGISGKTAAVVGRKLREIAKTHQVISITHLPQIASMADTNYRIYKETDGGRTFTHVAKLSEEERVREIARLLGGEEITDAALANARELISAGRENAQQ
ncbi:MAG: DNA repair protein RecN [Eubacterium sp.]|jgi:DNA repair protein RecN (Recombination protein N)